jgi:hypothetical protein
LSGRFDAPFWPSVEQRQLLRAALLGGAESVRAWEQLRSSVDVERLDPASYALFPLVYRQLERASAADPLLPKLRGTYRRTWYLNRLLLGRSSGALQALEGCGAQPVFLSSFELPGHYYGDFGLRRVDALRVVVSPATREAARRALVAGGWSSRDGVLPNGPRPVRFRKEDVDCFVQSAVFDLDDPCHDAVTFSLGDVEGRALSPTDELLYVCLNGARPMPWPSIGWIADAIMVLRAARDQIDWERLVDQGARLRCTLRLRDALRFLLDELEMPIPYDALQRLDRMPVLRRERLAHRLENTHPRPSDGPLARFLRTTSDQRLLSALTSLPRFLRDEWRLERSAQVPLTAIRKGAARVRARLR